MKDKGPIYNKSKEFALEIIKLCRNLQGDKEYIISNQIFRSATSIGANYREAIAAESDNDFIHKIAVATKEAHETQYWLELLSDGGYINQDYFNSLNNLLDEIIRMMTASVLTMKKKTMWCASHSKFIT